MKPLLLTKLQEASEALRSDRPEVAIRILGKVAEQARAGGDDHTEMEAVGLLAVASAALGDGGAARQQGMRALSLARQLGSTERIERYQGFLRQLNPEETFHDDPASVADETFDKVGQALMLGDGQAAVELLTPMITWSSWNDSPLIEASARGMMAQALMMTGDLGQARRHARKAVALADRLGDAGAAAHFRELLASLGDADDAGFNIAMSRLAAHARAVSRDAGQLIEADKPDEALALLLPLLRETVHARAQAAEATLRGLVAQAHLQAGDREEAGRQAARAVEIARSLGDDDAAASFESIRELAAGFVAPKQT
ncbi:MAG: hypothetical protein CSA54_00470 [Gammaproteobacteria bacterium]|nr:MAG: hypothetical protein CSA54_00470 [Gammaproteobacteria bacterium]